VSQIRLLVKISKHVNAPILLNLHFFNKRNTIISFAQVLINFTMGLVGALVAFLWQIWSVIRSYQVQLSNACECITSAGFCGTQK
jgi:hypothetical protein